jgi:Rps23 Pro-64 3,4-dihydroxylase Tpa1-like proline 4-hydroxylase
MNRKEIADLLVRRIEPEVARLKAGYEASRPRIGHFFIDELLPEPLAERIHAAFPDPGTMKLKKSLKEYKYVAAQMDRYDPILEEAIYAFQDPRVVALISAICGIDSLYPDEKLYAGGISLMGHRHFLNPHLDNSHDKDRNRWRVLNLLYYVSPGWELSNGGNLELWPEGLAGEPVVIHSRFNRLVVMATHDASWHSVSPIDCESGARCCVSNYYFSDQPLKADERFHVTSFRGRPDQPVRDLMLRADIRLRMAIRRIFKRGLVETDHVYRK